MLLLIKGVRGGVMQGQRKVFSTTEQHIQFQWGISTYTNVINILYQRITIEHILCITV